MPAQCYKRVYDGCVYAQNCFEPAKNCCIDSDGDFSASGRPFQHSTCQKLQNYMDHSLWSTRRGLCFGLQNISKHSAIKRLYTSVYRGLWKYVVWQVFEKIGSKTSQKVDSGKRNVRKLPVQIMVAAQRRRPALQQIWWWRRRLRLWK